MGPPGRIAGRPRQICRLGLVPVGQSSLTIGVEPGERDPGQSRDRGIEGRQIVDTELPQAAMPAGTGHHLHQLDRGAEKIREALGGVVHVEAGKRRI